MNELIKILLIEDNPGDALLIKEALKDSLYLNTTLFVAETIKGAAKYIDDEILLILLDLNLPDSDGIETVRSIRKFFPDTAIIVLTGIDDDNISLETLREGAQNYLNKSEITGKVLEKTIRFSLERHNIMQKLWVADKELVQHKFILEKAQEMAHVGSWIYDMVNELVELSDETYSIFGLDKIDFDKKSATFFSMIHDEDLPLVTNALNLCIKEKHRFEFKHRIVCKQGNIKWVNSQSEIYYDNNDKPYQLIGTIQDITEKKESEEKITKINRLYSFISAINQSIVHIKDERTLFNKVCNIAYDIGKFKMAWIGLLDKTYKVISLVDQKGINIDHLNLFANVTYENNGLTAQIIKTGTYLCINNVQEDLELEGWKLFALKQNIKSCLVLPIKRGETIIGTFNLYSDETNFFDSDEIKMLVEAAEDISFALTTFEREKQRTKAEANLLTIFNNTTTAYILFDNDLNVVSYNNHALIFGRNELHKTLKIGANVIDYYPDWQKANAEKIMLEALNGKNISTEVKYLQPNGSEKWYEITFFPVTNQNENIDGIMLSIIDFTEKKLAEEKLLRSESFNRGILNSLNSHIAVIDKDGNIIAVNDSWNKFAIENGETVLSRTGVGSNYFEACEKANQIENNIANDVLKGIKEVMDEKLAVFTFEYPCNSPTSKRWFAMRVLKFESEEPMAVMAHLDITERKQAELDRIQITNDLIKRNKDLEQFSYIVSHNLRSPVANIMGLTNVAIDDNLEASFRKEIMESLGVSVNKLDDVINDLNIILSTKQNLKEKKELVLFSEIANDVQRSIENIIEKENATITCDFSEINELFSLKSYFHSIFYNLISNSIKYYQPNIPPIIQIQSKLYPNKIELHFKDNGMGIDLDKKGDQVFGLYKRFHLNIDGKGMGLFMIKTQIESIGGRINIQSEINNGTTFIIEFDRYE